jgi:hypothetical protein
MHLFQCLNLQHNAHAQRRGQNCPTPLTKPMSHKAPLAPVRCRVWLARILVHGLDRCLCFFSEPCQIAFGHEAMPLPRRQLVQCCASFEVIKQCGNHIILVLDQLPKRKIRLMFASISVLHDLRDSVKNARTCVVQCTVFSAFNFFQSVSGMALMARKVRISLVSANAGNEPRPIAGATQERRL